MQTVKTEMSVVLNDTHFPFQDKPCIAAVEEFINYKKPTNIFLNGDIIDFYAISRYQKDPARELQLQEEIDETAAFLGRLRSYCPDTNIVYLKGNHEDRLQKYLYTNAKAMANLRGLALENLLSLVDKKIALVDSKTPIRFHDLVITHGHKVRSKSGATAHAMIDEMGCNGQSGHTHRSASVSRRYLDRTVTWIENGCLCGLNPEYAEGVADWQHSFTVLNVTDGRVNRQLIDLTGGSFVYEGNKFGS